MPTKKKRLPALRCDGLVRRLTLSNTQKAAIRKAMKADHRQLVIQWMTPDRGYGFPMDHMLRVVEMILNSPATRKHYASPNGRDEGRAGNA